MNLLITGCCGHIGSYLVDNVHKIKNIKKTFIVDNLESNTFYSLFNSKKKNNLNFVIKDLKDPNSLKGFKKIDYVIHLAALGSVPRSFEQTLLSSRNNLDIYIRLLDFIKDKKIKRLIVTSSSSIYGNSKFKLKN